MRWTVAGLTPCALAIDRQLQCVAASGLVWSVASTIVAIVSGGIEGLRPRPGRTEANWASPSALCRARHVRTVSGVTPAFSAMRAFAIPSLAKSNTRARCTIRAGAVRDFASRLSVSRCPFDSSSAAAARGMP
jgi:hypothetical protein